MKRVLAVVAVLAFVAWVGWQVYQKVTEKPESGRPGGGRAVPVAAEPVRRETIRDVAEFTGTLLPKSQFAVAPKVPGRLEKLLVNIGDSVKRGDLVAVVDVSTVIAVVHVIERDFPDVAVGQLATVTTDAYENKQFTGKIVRRAPVLKEESRQARVEIEMPNSEGLLALSASAAAVGSTGKKETHKHVIRTTTKPRIA